jgi:hypothetical protein
MKIKCRFFGVCIIVVFSFFLNIFSREKTKNNKKIHKDNHDRHNSLEYSGIAVGQGSTPLLHGQDRGNESNVLNIGGLVQPRTKICTKSGVEIEIDGKARIEGSFGKNTTLLNSKNYGLDTFWVPGKSTIDLGFGMSYGKYSVYERDIVNLGINMRSRSSWGKPEEIAVTTATKIKEGDVSFGIHNHKIGVPVVYLRGADLTFDLNAMFDADFSKPIQRFKLGFFPVEIGRGISLGAAYAVTPDFLTYEPVDIIQEFAPGFMFYGNFDLENIFGYRCYIGFLKNESASFGDINEPIRINQYGKRYLPQRGFGVLNIVQATQFDWKILNKDKNKVTFSPYLLIVHDGQETTVLPFDTYSNFVTLGFEFSGEEKDMEFDFEFAQNFGNQNVYGIDTNSIIKEQRTCALNGVNGNNLNSSVSVLTNDGVKYIGVDNTTDLNNKNAVFLGNSNSRQIAINSVYQNASSNDKIFNVPGEKSYQLQNSKDRFRDPYTNFLNGFMAVLDWAYHFKFFNNDVKWALAAGYASGDENPNKSLEAAGDHLKNSVYEGFVGVQEIYSGKMVRSVFMMSGVGRIPRILSIPAILQTSENLKDLEAADVVGYPSRINRFNNISYLGTSINTVICGCNYDWKLNPNILVFFQPSPPVIYNQYLINKLGKTQISAFLGTEVNLFLEIISKTVEGLKFYVVATMFFPGSYYSDLKGVPLDKKQLDYIRNINKGILTEFVPMLGNNNAFYINFGVEFKF